MGKITSMKLETDTQTLKVFLEWRDIDTLKEGSTVAERYNGEHKFNLACTLESINAENWTETSSFPTSIEFNEYVHDFFVSLSVFDIRFSFSSSMTITLCPNPHFKTAKIIFPT